MWLIFAYVFAYWTAFFQIVSTTRPVHFLGTIAHCTRQICHTHVKFVKHTRLVVVDYSMHLIVKETQKN